MLNFAVLITNLIQVANQIVRLDQGLFILEYFFRNFKFLQFTDQFPKARIKVVFDLVVCPPRNVVSDFGPLIAVNLVSFHEHVLFIRIPNAFFDFVVQVIVPSFPALFTISI